MSETFKLRPGADYPLGPTYDGAGVNFAVYAPEADRVELCLFSDVAAAVESSSIDLFGPSHGVWSVYVESLRPGQLYGYRVHGPFDPSDGRRHNPCKLLFDPYARAVGRPLDWSDELFGFPAAEGLPASPRATSLRCERDSAPFAPLAAVIEGGFDWGDDRPPRTPWTDTVIYETHVKGLTMRHPDVPEALRGTYAGLASEPVLRYLTDLGVTAVELLPVHHHVDEYRLIQLGLRNYWGYNTLAFFAPDLAYAADPTPEGAVKEFKHMVRLLHDAGLEVLLDVVYNHTCEGNERGPTVSWRGFGNAQYYRLDPQNPAHHINYTGTGNTVDLRHPRALQMVADSLRYWVEEMHVDGFRFDLASVLGRESDRFERGAGFFDVVAQDPVLSQVKLIAEPWDIGPGGYQVGGYPTGWSEWNGRYRDDVRRFWKGDAGMLGAFATRLSGSSDAYRHSDREPTASVNFITAHDGFCLNDLVTYERKHNLANHEFNRDGEMHNNSRNFGVEGPTDQPGVRGLRERQKRSMLATLFFSVGVPMLLAGDELSRTQQGNNNAYCQDNEISWLDWDLDDDKRRLHNFVRRLIALRRETPQLRRRRFFTGDKVGDSGLRDLSWRAASGKELDGQQWGEPNRRAVAAYFAAEQGAPPVYLMLNASDAPVDFQLPELEDGARWDLLFDTALPDTDDQPHALASHSYPVQEHGVVALRVNPGDNA